MFCRRDGSFEYPSGIFPSSSEHFMVVRMLWLSTPQVAISVFTSQAVARSVAAAQPCIAIATTLSDNESNMGLFQSKYRNIPFLNDESNNAVRKGAVLHACVTQRRDAASRAKTAYLLVKLPRKPSVHPRFFLSTEDGVGTSVRASSWASRAAPPPSHPPAPNDITWSV